MVIRSHEDKMEASKKTKLRHIIENYRYVTLNKKFDKSDNFKKEDRLKLIR